MDAELLAVGIVVSCCLNASTTQNASSEFSESKATELSVLLRAVEKLALLVRAHGHHRPGEKVVLYRVACAQSTVVRRGEMSAGAQQVLGVRLKGFVKKVLSHHQLAHLLSTCCLVVQSGHGQEGGANGLTSWLHLLSLAEQAEGVLRGLAVFLLATNKVRYLCCITIVD